MGASAIALGHFTHGFLLALGYKVVWTISDGQSLKLHLYFYLLINMNLALGA